MRRGGHSINSRSGTRSRARSRLPPAWRRRTVPRRPARAGSSVTVPAHRMGLARSRCRLSPTHSRQHPCAPSTPRLVIQPRSLRHEVMPRSVPQTCKLRIRAGRNRRHDAAGERQFQARAGGVPSSGMAIPVARASSQNEKPRRSGAFHEQGTRLRPRTRR